MDIEKYHPSIRVIHWLMFVLFAIIFVFGVVMVEFKEAKPWSMYSFHKATGVLVFGLILIRIIARWLTKVPPPSSAISSLEHGIANIVVSLLYLFMLMIPITGYVLSNVHGHEVYFYGLELPSLLSANPEWENITSLVHYYTTYSFLGLIGLHTLAVIKYHFTGREVLRRIT